MENTKTVLDASMINQTARIKGKVRYAKVTEFLEGDALKADIARNKSFGAKYPITDPYFSINLNDASIVSSTGVLTPFEEYIRDKKLFCDKTGMWRANCAQRAGKKSNAAPGEDPYVKILPAIWDASTKPVTILQGNYGGKEYRLSSEIAPETEVIIEYQCRKSNQANPLVLLKNIIITGNAKFLEGGSQLPETIKDMGVTAGDITVGDRAKEITEATITNAKAATETSAASLPQIPEDDVAAVANGMIPGAPVAPAAPVNNTAAPTSTPVSQPNPYGNQAPTQGMSMPDGTA